MPKKKVNKNKKLEIMILLVAVAFTAALVLQISGLTGFSIYGIDIPEEQAVTQEPVQEETVSEEYVLPEEPESIQEELPTQEQIDYGISASATSTYTLADSTNNKAYNKKSGGANPPTSPGGAGYTEYISTEYTYAANLDGLSNIWRESIESMDNSYESTALDTYINLLYTIKVNESIGDITNITLTWVGYDPLNAGGRFYLYIWNHASSSWTNWLTETEAQSSDQTYTHTYTSGISNFINSSGYMHIGVAGAYSAPIEGIDYPEIHENYVEVEVNYISGPSPPDADNFPVEYGSTNFSAVANVTNVSDMALGTQYGIIRWVNPVNADGEDYDSYVIINASFVSINTPSLDTTINASANVTLYNVNCSGFYLHYAPRFYSTIGDLITDSSARIIATEANIGGNCIDASVCTDVSCVGGENGNLSFIAQHFTGFGVGNDTLLTIWDETDSGTKYNTEQVRFFANYTYSNGTFISDANCTIDFNDSSSYMYPNASINLFEYSRSFSSAGIYEWNVTCNRTGLTTLDAIDNATITFLNCSCGTCTECTTDFNNPLCHEINLIADIIDNIGNCMVLSSLNNKVFNGGGHRIDLLRGGDLSIDEEYDPSAIYTYGIYLFNSNNITIKNCTFSDFSFGITLRTSSNSTITNNIVFNNTDGGIYLFSTSNNNNITNNNITNNVIGIYVDSVSGNDIRDNNITENSNIGIFLPGGSGNTVDNNRISGNSNGVYLSSSSGNNITGNNITGNTNDGVYLSGGSGNNITNNDINSNTHDGISLISSSGNILAGNTFSGNTHANLYLRANFNNTVSGSVISPYVIFADSSGNEQIKYTDTLNLTNAVNFGSVVALSSNSIFVNSSAENEINKSAQLSMYSITFENPEPIVDYNDNGTFERCLPPTCTEVSYSSGVFVYNVTHFTNYSSQETFNCSCNTCSGCIADLNNPLCLVVNLTANITNSGTCINNPANFSNKTFDCQNNHIQGTSSGYGIFMSADQNNTIQNCEIYNFLGGIYLFASSNNNVLRNLILRDNSYGIYFDVSHNITLTNSTIYNNDNDGIRIKNNTFYNTIDNNDIYNNSGYGIFINDTDHNTINNNNISGNTDGIGIFGSYNNITNNLIYNHRGSSSAIKLYTPRAPPEPACAGFGEPCTVNEDCCVPWSCDPKAHICTSFDSYNRFENNSIWNNTYGIYMADEDNNTVTNNRIWDCDYGIYLNVSVQNVFTDNMISNNTVSEIFIEINSSGNIFTNQQISSYPTNISFIYSPEAYAGYINIRGVTAAPSSNPSIEWNNTGKYVNITNSNGPAWLFLNISYADANLTTLIESSLKIWKYNSSGWHEDSWNTTRILDTSNKVAGANITNFASIFALLALINDTTPPSNATVILNATSPNNYTIDDLTCYANATDDIETTLTAYYKWQNNSIEVTSLAGNTTIPGGTQTLVSTVASGNTTAGENWTCSVLTSDGTNNASWAYSNNLTIKSLPLPNSSNFPAGYGSTNFSAIEDLTNVPNMTLATQYGKIKWLNPVNAAGEDYDSYVRINGSFVSINTSALNETINATANVTLYNVDCSDFILHYGPGFYGAVGELLTDNSKTIMATEANIGGDCIDNTVCTDVSCTGGASGNLSFIAQHFTGFGIGVDANLTIWDETDAGMPYGNQIKYIGEQVRFFANYTYSNGSLINDANCTINFLDSSSYMQLNASIDLFEYKRSFSSAGNYSWNVSCNRTGFTTLNASDNVTIIYCTCASCSDCEAKLNDTSCHYVKLISNIAGHSGTCINNPIRFENKTFDCGGNYISGDDAGSDFGIYLNNLNNNTIQNCNISAFYHGIYMRDTVANTFINITSSDNNWNGIYLRTFSNSNLTSINSHNNAYAGILLYSSSNNNNFISVNSNNNNNYGIYLYSSSNNNFTNIITQNNTNWEFSSLSTSLNNLVINLTTWQNVLSFKSKDINLKGLQASEAPSIDPTGYQNISKYINATSNSVDSWLFANFSYSDSDLGNITNESALIIARWNGAWETNTSAFADEYGVDNESNFVYANITSFASTYVPLGPVFVNDTTPPSNATVILNATSENNYTIDNLTCYANATDDIASFIKIYYKWYNNSAEVTNLAGSITIPKDTMSLVSTVSLGNTTVGENWICSVLASDETNNASWVNSSEVTITAVPPCYCSSCATCGAQLNNASCFDVRLTSDITSTTTCINDPVNSDDKIFDCQNHIIMRPTLAPTSPVYSGIYFNRTQGVTIRNCLVANFTKGIQVAESNNTLLDNVDSFKNSFDGIIITDSHATTITNSRVYNNEYEGIAIYGLTPAEYVYNNSLSNINISGNLRRGLTMDRISDSNFTSIILYNNSAGGVSFQHVHNSNFISITSYNNSGGISFSFSDNNTFTSINSYSNAYNGISLTSSDNNNFTSINSHSNYNSGIDLSSASNNTFISVNVYNNSASEIYIEDDSLENTFTNQKIGIDYPTNISFIYSTSSFTGNIKIKEVDDPPSDSSGYTNIGKYVNITNTLGPVWLFLNLSYLDSDLPTDLENESNITMWKYNETGWTEVANSTVNISDNIVSANITSFSIFAPLGTAIAAAPAVPAPAPGGVSVGGGVGAICLEQWECSGWSPCTPENRQYRQCWDLNNCEEKFAQGAVDYIKKTEKPSEIRDCIYAGNCSDSIQNQGETGIDCGGPCPPCLEMPVAIEKINLFWLLLILLIALTIADSYCIYQHYHKKDKLVRRTYEILGIIFFIGVIILSAYLSYINPYVLVIPISLIIYIIIITWYFSMPVFREEFKARRREKLAEKRKQLEKEVQEKVAEKKRKAYIRQKKLAEKRKRKEVIAAQVAAIKRRKTLAKQKKREEKERIKKQKAAEKRKEQEEKERLKRQKAAEKAAETRKEREEKEKLKRQRAAEKRKETIQQQKKVEEKQRKEAAEKRREREEKQRKEQIVAQVKAARKRREKYIEEKRIKAERAEKRRKTTKQKKKVQERQRKKTAEKRREKSLEQKKLEEKEREKEMIERLKQREKEIMEKLRKLKKRGY